MMENCEYCELPFTEANPLYYSKKHKKCYNRNYAKGYVRKKNLKSGICPLCKESITGTGMLIRNMHKKCYRKNYWKITSDRREKTKRQYAKSDFEAIEYQTRDYKYQGSRLTIDEIRHIEEDRKESITALETFKERMLKTGGWADTIDCYTLIHLFELYYPKNTTFLDAKPINIQLIYMWNWIKTYNWNPSIINVTVSTGS